MTLEQRLDAQVTIALNICRCAEGWQASLERRTGVFSIGVGETPSAAVTAVLTPWGEIEPPVKDERQGEMSLAPPSVFD